MSGCIPEDNPYRKGTHNFANHKHRAIDIIEDENRLFISRALYDKLVNITGDGGATENPTGKIDPRNIVWDKNYRPLTDVQIKSFTDKAEKNHTHSALSVSETPTRIWFTPTERIDLSNLKDKISSANWLTKVIQSNTDNYIELGSKLTHILFIVRYIARTAAATEFNTIYISYDPNTDIIEKIGNIYHGAFVGIENITARKSPTDGNKIELTVTVGNSVINLFRYNIEKIPQ